MTISNMTIFLQTLKYDYLQYDYFLKIIVIFEIQNMTKKPMGPRRPRQLVLMDGGWWWMVDGGWTGTPKSKKT